jgi:hypothetical protein
MLGKSQHIQSRNNMDFYGSACKIPIKLKYKQQTKIAALRLLWLCFCARTVTTAKTHKHCIPKPINPAQRIHPKPPDFSLLPLKSKLANKNSKHPPPTANSPLSALRTPPLLPSPEPQQFLT